LFCRSVTSINPGECVIANGTLAAAITDCGVTPQAQNTGISSGATGTKRERSGALRTTVVRSGGAVTPPDDWVDKMSPFSEKRLQQDQAALQRTARNL
jgi:hypothetical protein